MLNQRRMTADPFEVIMRSMRRSMEDDVDAEGRPYGAGGRSSDQVYTCQQS